METLIYGKNGEKAMRDLNRIYDPINMYLFHVSLKLKSIISYCYQFCILLFF